MGQYHTGILLKANWKKLKNPIEFSCCSWDFGSGMKQMEHSYIGNPYVVLYEQMLSSKEYFGLPVVWCGDYADHLKTKVYNKMEINIGSRIDSEESAVTRAYLESLLGCDWRSLFTEENHCTTLVPFNQDVWDKLLDLPDVYVDYELDLYDKANDFEHKNRKKIGDIQSKYGHDETYHKYLVNLDKKEYVVLKKFKPSRFQMHPLPLLTCNSIERGGGDYYKIDGVDNGFGYLGRWAYDRLGVLNRLTKEYKGFTEIKPNFIPDW